jgi:hypothetical protein
VAMFASSLIMGFGVCCGSQEVKIGASDIVKNLHFPNGTAIIPPGSVVYVSTDDPDGICKNCLFNRKPCDTYPSPKPVGCPEDVSDSLRVTTILLPCMYSPVHLHCPAVVESLCASGMEDSLLTRLSKGGLHRPCEPQHLRHD